jgi:signal transduction histidine kinase
VENTTQGIVKHVNAALARLLEGDADGAGASLDLIPGDLPDGDDCSELVAQFRKFIAQYKAGTEFINALADGNLDFEPPRQNYVISHYKALQSNLLHLTWQTQQIAKGDYNQRVTYLGEFSVAFNKLIEALREKRRMEEELKELLATREKFMSIISHDLRSPFNAILGFADLFHQDYDELTDEDRKRFIDHIRTASRNAFRLLENLLEWSRIQTGRIRFDPENLNLSRLVFETLSLLSPAAEKKDIHLFSRVDVTADLFADKNAVLSILRNLVNNAIKFTGRGGRVTIASATENGFVTVSVTDTGVGIAASDLAKLFRLDEKFKTDGTDNEKGTGLGLLLCKEFTEKSGGTIGVESEPGKGSRFYFTLPAAK